MSTGRIALSFVDPNRGRSRFSRSRSYSARVVRDTLVEPISRHLAARSEKVGSTVVTGRRPASASISFSWFSAMRLGPRIVFIV